MSRLLDLLKTAERQRNKRDGRRAKTSNRIPGVSDDAPVVGGVSGADSDIGRAQEPAQEHHDVGRRTVAQRAARPVWTLAESAPALRLDTDVSAFARRVDATARRPATGGPVQASPDAAGAGTRP